MRLSPSLVYLRLVAVAFHSLLQLVDGVRHLFGRRVLLDRLIGDADAAVQIQAQLDLIHVAVAHIPENSDSNDQYDQAQKALSFVAFHCSFLL